MNIPSGIISYCIGVLSGVTLPILHKTYVYMTAIRPLKRVWKEFISKETYAILSCSDLVIDIDSFSMGMYDSMALAEIRELFSSFPKTFLQPYVSKYFPPYLNRNNIILFGGPLSNVLTKKIMVDKRETYLQFKNHTIINTQNNEIFEPKIVDDRVTTDYGVIIKLRSPFNRNLSLMIIAGCYDYGTYLSSLMLTDPTFVKDLLKIVETSEFEVVVSGDILKGVPQTPKIEKKGIVRRD